MRTIRMILTLVTTLAVWDCSLPEISSCLGLSHDQLHARYADVVKKGRDMGAMSIKRKIYEMAINGNATLLIWLSKVRFGWREEAQTMNTVINVTVKDVP